MDLELDESAMFVVEVAAGSVETVLFVDSQDRLVQLMPPRAFVLLQLAAVLLLLPAIIE